MPPRVNLRSSAVKRIMQEAAERSDPETDGFVAAPLETDIFEWHCTLRGVKGTDYEGGLYHLRILLPATYPMSAPDIVLLTPNGRFELGKKICIDGLTSFHAGSWQPAWGVRTAITGLRAFWTQEGEALSAIGALDVPKAERRRLAELSREWTCPTCGESNAVLLPDTPETEDTNAEAGPSGQPSDKTDTPDTTGLAESEAAAETSGAADLPVFASSTGPSVTHVQCSAEAATNPAPSLPSNGVTPSAEETTVAPPRSAPLPPAERPPDAPEQAEPFEPPRVVASRSPPQPVPESEVRARAVPGPRNSSPPAAQRPPEPAPGLDARAHAVPARFTAPPAAAPARARPPLWLDLLIGMLVMLLLVLLAEKR